jgi:hypothetical protein
LGKIRAIGDGRRPVGVGPMPLCGSGEPDYRSKRPYSRVRMAEIGDLADAIADPAVAVSYQRKCSTV